MSADPLANLIEPGALAEQAALSEVGLSIAISLKRIADALTGNLDLSGLHSQLTQAAWEAGQNFGRGIDVGRSQ